MRKFFILVLIILFSNIFLYYKDYFTWREKIDYLFFQIYHADSLLLDNKSLALRQARSFVDEAITAGDLELSTGPCLKEEFLPNWSLDFVHQPRTEVDEQPENQCQYFLTGRTNRLIEYDIFGNFSGIKSKR